MAGVIRRNVASLLNIVDLRVIVFENRVIFFLTLLHVDESISGTGDEHGRCTMVIWVVRDLEVADVALDVALPANACLGYELLTLPIPQEDLPVGLTGQRDYEAVLLRVEGAGDKFLGIVGVDILYLLRQRLLLLLARDVEDREFALVSSGHPLTHRYVLLALRDGHVGDRFRVFGAYCAEREKRRFQLCSKSKSTTFSN